jgi:hypothetical protein
MGQAIYYCCRCSNQLREAQFEAGKACRTDDLVCCAACAPEVLRTLPADQARLLQAQIDGPAKPAAPVRAPLRESSRAMPLPPKTAPARKTGMIAAGAGVGAAVILILLMAVGGGGEKNTPRKDAPKPSPTEEPGRPGTPAQEALRKARKFAVENPEDLEGQLREFQEVAFKDDKGESGEAARKAMAAIRDRQREAAERAGAALDGEIAGPLDREDFAAALRLVQAAKARMPGAPWAFEKRERAVRDRLSKAFEALKEGAAQAKSKGDAAELDRLKERAKAWALADELEKFLSTVEGPAVVLDDFDGTRKGWTFTNGQEFAGAKGSFTVESPGGRGGQGGGRLQADFSGGGAYVGVWLNLPGRSGQEVKEVRLWARTEAATHYMVRVGDASGQCFQRKFPLPPSGEWQELAIRFAGFSGAEHWGGANDGRVHAPVKGFGIHLVKDGLVKGAQKAGLWIDDVRGVYGAKSD